MAWVGQQPHYVTPTSSARTQDPYKEAIATPGAAKDLWHGSLNEQPSSSNQTIQSVTVIFRKANGQFQTEA